MIFSWTQIGRSGNSQREIGASDREIFARQKYRVFLSKIGTFDTLYGQGEVIKNEKEQYMSVLYLKLM